MKELTIENILLDQQDEEEMNVKIDHVTMMIDTMDENLLLRMDLPYKYVAPEILCAKECNAVVDMWSVGVILYTILCGYNPFVADDIPSEFENILEAKFDFNDEIWDNISEAAKDLLRQLLVGEPSQRLTAAKCLEHEWIAAARKKKKKK